jgi:hypothetical protein
MTQLLWGAVGAHTSEQIPTMTDSIDELSRVTHEHVKQADTAIEEDFV